ncbi:GtrA family protein [Rhodoplanes sp. TEM]|uniref:GtrA family protein n=1 Tax=Rhodoplanes tepidamans TaxID=200616 RepID=A0ABT5J8X7_RHOTP|nr:MULTISPECIES: GtrA family protein [Rhodoplanes]MDC7786107.1 GtrA family protein [Rhodoplanes tepidamans]MDC7982774.1 GtrA family protein [Rhodoplanes sp. TEM]MDQ0357229.1 putative flippase GtrA [Rhodoplanes tepidamans]
MEPTRLESLFPRAAPAVRRRAGMMRKAASFALVGVVNTAVDASVFFVALTALQSAGASVRAFETMSGLCGCGGADDLMLIAANLMGWVVGVTGSYVLNSTFTFAEESGRTLRLRDYGAFAASGVLGAVANTTTLVLVAQVMPVWFAKACAILVSFVVNFTMSHFVVFRPRRTREDAVGADATKP